MLVIKIHQAIMSSFFGDWPVDGSMSRSIVLYILVLYSNYAQSYFEKTSVPNAITLCTTKSFKPVTNIFTFKTSLLKTVTLCTTKPFIQVTNSVTSQTFLLETITLCTTSPLSNFTDQSFIAHWTGERTSTTYD